MENIAKNGVKRALLAVALAVAFLTLVPAVSSILVVSSAWSNRSDVSQNAGGSTVINKNGETPAWIADLIDQERNSGTAEIEIDPNSGLAI
ncbi:MAG: hypothetical protein AB7S41_16690 [Parvibaculaceae bacterium]